MSDKISCAHDKWSIGIDDNNGIVKIEYHNHPIYSTLELYDASPDDLDNLGEMFQTYAKLARARAKGSK